ncbi:MAG: DNA mismatch repair endonuclease MutL [Methanosarcinales archaeon]|nr:DNA mismatch repair endonuclease MutL [Methanosarcinales archaeon]
MKIRLLDPETVQKIAAGEVIERPASVVKELAENSVDAGATRILIELQEGGKELIRVADDGCGMDREDLELAFLSHATSKISRVEDLDRVTTLGFRGEALASIASVSRSVEVYTRPRTSSRGTCLRMEDGRAVEVREAGCPAGTSIAVKGLFHNLPARHKHLQSARQETARRVGLVTEMAIINHRISFELFSGRRNVFRSSRSDSWEGCLVQVLGLEVVKGMVPVFGRGEGVSFHGLVGDPSVARSAPDWIFLYVNGRPVSSRALVSSLREAYRTLLPGGRSPVAVISLQVDPSLVDVNVHPTKREVRFLQESLISELLIGSVSRALRSRFESKEPRASALPPDLKPPAPGSVQRTLSLDDGRLSLDLAREPETTEQSPGLKIIGQLLDLYILAEDGGGLVLIDQHAAAERIRYEMLQRRFRERTLAQELIAPLTVELSPREQVMLDSWREMLQEMGFDIQPFGGNTFTVRSLPATGCRLESPEAVHAVLVDLFNMGRVNPDSTSQDEVLKLLACRGSIKSGRHLSQKEMEGLFHDLMQCDSPRTCPHGRPTMIFIQSSELERMFGRR